MASEEVTKNCIPFDAGDFMRMRIVLKQKQNQKNPSHMQLLLENEFDVLFLFEN